MSPSLGPCLSELRTAPGRASSASFRSRGAELDGASGTCHCDRQTAAALDSRAEHSARTEGSPHGSSHSPIEGSPAKNQGNLPHRACQSGGESSELSQVDIGRDSVVQYSPAPGQASGAALKPVKSVTQAYARLGITVQDTRVWNAAAWRAEWARCGAANSVMGGVWRIQAIHFIMKHRCVRPFATWRVCESVHIRLLHSDSIPDIAAQVPRPWHETCHTENPRWEILGPFKYMLLSTLF